MLAGVPASEEVRQNERKRLGLDRPVVERYFTFLAKAAQGDLGESFRTRQPVGKMILEQAVRRCSSRLAACSSASWWGSCSAWRRG